MPESGPVDLSDFFHLSIDPMLVTGFDAIVVATNPACVRALGTDITGGNFAPYLHEEDLGPAREEAAKLFTGEKDTVDYETRVKVADGTYRWWRWAVKAAHEKQLLYAIATDIDDRRRAEERYEILLRALSDFGEGVLITDGKRYLFANDAYCRISGYTRDEILNFESVWVPTPPEDREALSARLRERLAGGQVQDHYEARLVHKDGHYVDVEVAVKMMQTPEGPRLISLINDISEAKRMRTFQEKFIADAAHELRNPIAILTGMTEILESSWRELGEKEIEASVAALGRQGRRLGALVTNMLDLTRLQQGRVEVELHPVDVYPVVQRVLEALPEHAGTTIENEVPPRTLVMGDDARVDQILTNLMTNAVRYGGDQVTVSPTSDDEWVTIRVSDNGPGVPKAFVPHLFEPFTRGNNASGTGGAGLGLAIVNELVAALDGEISYEDNESGGARFSVRLRSAAE